MQVVTVYYLGGYFKTICKQSEPLIPSDWIKTPLTNNRYYSYIQVLIRKGDLVGPITQYNEILLVYLIK